MAEIRPYENGSSEPNSLHLHVYRAPSDKTQLIANLSWDRLYPEGTWNRVTLADKENVESYEAAVAIANQYADQRSIPIVFVENDAA